MGSPPRGRGRLRTATASCPDGGLTPAWAGTAHHRPHNGRGRGAHPRVGGDGPTAEDRAKVEKGSPPRGRGRHAIEPPPGGVEGLTPAWAGTAGQAGGPGQACWAHPRVGGDGAALPWADSYKQGSPPRGRGRQGGWRQGHGWTGLTPAWAGTAFRSASRSRLGGAHPRVGGDGGAPWLCRWFGSGLTPAWAGTAHVVREHLLPDGAHPRVGGDGGIVLYRDKLPKGSPPRGRGRPCRCAACCRCRGLTPAWAGTADMRLP